MSIYFTEIESPVGTLVATSDGTALTGLYMNERPGRSGWIERPDAEPFAAARAQLKDYFAGRLRAFDLPLAPAGPEFHQRVWEALRGIPYGTTTTYGDIARRLTGSVAASRAVGLANGKNPLSIVVPCHRVIGAGGKLVGYSGGLDRKRALLALEAGVAHQGTTPALDFG